jgi:hypothetical protein
MQRYQPVEQLEPRFAPRGASRPLLLILLRSESPVGVRLKAAAGVNRLDVAAVYAPQSKYYKVF